MTEFSEAQVSHEPTEEVTVTYQQWQHEFGDDYVETVREVMTFKELLYDLKDFFLREHIDLTTMKVEFADGSIAMPKLVLTHE